MRASTLVVFLALALQFATPISAEISINAGPVVVRMGWAPVFCFSGSNNPNEEQFCGRTPPSLTRFTAWRALRLLVLNATDGKEVTDCAAPPPFDPRQISKDTQKALACIGNSYSLPDNNMAWWANIWEDERNCVPALTGMSQKAYFKLMVSTFTKYNLDTMLKKSGLFPLSLPRGQVEVNGVPENGTLMEANLLIDNFNATFGHRAVYTCDGATRKRFSALSFCVDNKPPHKIVDCHENFLKVAARCKDSPVLLFKTDDSIPPTKKCLDYYPAFKKWGNDDKDRNTFMLRKP